MSGELSLDAALRDVASKNDRARHLAIRNLASALLAEAGLASPTWDASSHHRRGAQVLEILQRVVAEEGPPQQQHQNRGMAMIGLGQLGEPGLLNTALAWLELDGEDEATMFLREAALIALSMLGTVAPAQAPDRETIRRRLGEALTSRHDDVRFQAGVALAELGGDEVEATLVDALRREREPRVRENLVCALATFDPPGPRAREQLREILESDEAATPIGFEAALALAAARDPAGADRLVDAVADREERDRALEALAALGSRAPASAQPPIRELADAWLTPAITKVRAAYALARLDPAQGLPRLHKLARHMRAAVREGVQDAYAAIAALEEREQTEPAPE